MRIFGSILKHLPVPVGIQPYHHQVSTPEQLNDVKNIFKTIFLLHLTAVSQKLVSSSRKKQLKFCYCCIFALLKNLILIFLFFLCYRRTRCNPKENFHKMGQQTFEKGNSRFFLLYLLTCFTSYFYYYFFCELCVCLLLFLLCLFFVLFCCLFLNELNENFLAVALNERNGKEKFYFFRISRKFILPARDSLTR